MLLCITTAAFAQKRQQQPAVAPPVKTDSAKTTEPGKPKPYKEVITGTTVSQAGLFKVHQQNEQFFFEIPEHLLNRDILVVNRVSKAAAGLRPQVNIYAGDQVAENVIRFETGPSHRLFMKRMVFRENAKDTTANGLYRAVINSNLQPIVAAFPVKAYGEDSAKTKTYVIDITSFLQTENEILYFGPEAKKALALGGVQNDKSYTASVKTFPLNVEIRSVRTYQAPPALPVTYELNSSLLLLPETPMKPRFADARVGFFARGFVDFDVNPQGIKEQAFITRWRLEPKAEDQQRYLRGELVEPKQPIIYYIDPATPKKWVPYLIAGVNDWQAAFEQAGFKNAIIALPAPENDPSWSIEDARHNVLVYKPSAIANASGPHVHDPRSGEIMETHINWYHNIMQLLHDWYLVQAGAIDPRARQPQLNDSLMGELIRFVSSHEVGHTLGLMHNFGSSSTIPVALLRNKAYVEAHGHTPSIMDYARFNYVAQPEDGITEKGIFPRIGEYDKWAIQWGYRWMPQFPTAESEAGYLNKLIIDSLSRNKRLFFGSEYESLDPRSQSEDLGDDAIQASTYGIKNLQRILPHLREWTTEPNEGYEALRDLYDKVFRQYNLYVQHVLKSIGGEYHTFKSVEQPGGVYDPVPYEKQKAALQFLDKYVFNIPSWFMDSDTSAVVKSSPAAYVHASQSGVLFRLLGSGIITEFIRNQENLKGKKGYTATEYLADLKKMVWSELYTGQPVSAQRRTLQRIYLTNLNRAFQATGEIVGRNSGNGTIYYMNPDPTANDVSSLVRAHLVVLKKEIQQAIPSQKGLARYHLEDMVLRIEELLKPPAKK
jgi:hypothetical protein